MNNTVRNILLVGAFTGIVICGARAIYNESKENKEPVRVYAWKGHTQPVYQNGGVRFQQGNCLWKSTNYFDHGFNGRLSKVIYYASVNGKLAKVEIREGDPRLKDFTPKYLEIRDKATKGN
jgi:hypothetical protein